ncbi:hypothetical protein ACIBG4_25390 [Nonomuraea sp. NPDC050383]
MDPAALPHLGRLLGGTRQIGDPEVDFERALDMLIHGLVAEAARIRSASR